MKQRVTFLFLKPVFMLFFLSLFSLAVWGQDNNAGGGGSDNNSSTTTTKKSSISVNSNDNSGTTTWYASPWVWVIGAAVFILLLVALLSNRGRDTVSSDRVRVTRTVERDSGSDVV